MIEEVDFRIRSALSNLVRFLQGRFHDVFATGHDRVLDRCDEAPALASDPHPEAQRREHLEQQPWIRWHAGILYVARWPFVIVRLGLEFQSAERQR